MKGVARALFSGSVTAYDVDVAEANTVKAMRPCSLQAMSTDIDKELLKAGKVIFLVADRKGNEMEINTSQRHIGLHNPTLSSGTSADLGLRMTTILSP
ncbi:hypothetical protein J1N35_041144 [Gossypium stocksii]|uniref:Uncharacterized protein n=1 Tax=Gossypium stocksii TaxID=47602 RepID=A0A9D3ZJ54_9ROSI|nr:hypothetical protein J1N35_041144 [Gossypium stocksii]